MIGLVTAYDGAQACAINDQDSRQLLQDKGLMIAAYTAQSRPRTLSPSRRV